MSNVSAQNGVATNRRGPKSAVRAALIAAIPILAIVGFLEKEGMLAPPEPVLLGNPAPLFDAAAHDGRTFRLTDYKGRPVYLAFVPDLGSETRAEALSLQTHLADFDMAGGKVFLVAPTSKDTARRFHDDLKLDYPVLVDPNRALFTAFRVDPTSRATAVVAPNATLKYLFRDIDTRYHGGQLIDLTGCCLDDVVAARTNGVGKKLGDLSLPLADGSGMANVFGDSSQKATAVVFLSVKCPCSNSYNERLRNLFPEWRRKGVRFVGIYANADETLTEIAAHAKANGFTFPVLRDERGLAIAHFDAHVTPEAFVLDTTRILRYQGRVDGARDAADAKTHELPEALGALLSGKKPPSPKPAFGCAIVRPALTQRQ